MACRKGQQTRHVLGGAGSLLRSRAALAGAARQGLLGLLGLACPQAAAEWEYPLADGENGCATDSQQRPSCPQQHELDGSSQPAGQTHGWLGWLGWLAVLQVGDGPAPESPMALPNLNRIRRINATLPPLREDHTVPWQQVAGFRRLLISRLHLILPQS